MGPPGRFCFSSRLASRFWKSANKKCVCYLSRMGVNSLSGVTEVRPKEAAELLGCSRALVYVLMNEGQLDYRTLKRRGRAWGLRFITVASIEKLRAQRGTYEPTTA